MPVREMANPIPVLTGSEYREKKTMKKQVRQNTTGMKIGTCGDVRSDSVIGIHNVYEQSCACVFGGIK